MQRGSFFIAAFAHLTRHLIVARIPTRPGGGDDQVANWVGRHPRSPPKQTQIRYIFCAAQPECAFSIAEPKILQSLSACRVICSP